MKKQPDLRTIPSSKRTYLDYTSAKTSAEFLLEMGRILEGLVNNLPEGAKITEVAIESDYPPYDHDRSSFLIVRYERKETIEEYTTRLLQDQCYREQRKEEYLRLKKEFEG